MLASTTAGIYQRDASTLAKGGTFVLGCAVCVNPQNFADFGVDGGVTFTDQLSDDLHADVSSNGTVTGSSSIPATSLISPTQLAQSGFSSLQVYSNGAVTLPVGTAIALAPNPDSGLTVKSGTSIDILGGITAPGGTVNLATVATTDQQAHDIRIGAGAIIDTSGNWINDSPLVTATAYTGPRQISGGSVSISANGDLLLGNASTINVSGGGRVKQDNTLTAGTAGSISLAASYDSNHGAGPVANLVGKIDMGPGVNLLGAVLGNGQGGTLKLQSGSVTVGDTAAGTLGELLLAPDFFTHGGFFQYNIVGENDIFIGDTTGADARVTIAPLQQNLVFTRNPLLQRTGTAVSGFTNLQTQPPAQRQAASVSFGTGTSDIKGSEVGDITLAHNASIVTDPGATVTLAATGLNANLMVLGSIITPGGNINLQLGSTKLQTGQDPGFIADQRIEIGSDAVLSATGYAKIDTANPLHYRQGPVLDGGRISIVADKGFVVADQGSVIDVSGAAGILDLLTTHGVAATTVAGNAGAITIDAREGIELQGSLRGFAATMNGKPVAGAGGGTLSIGLGTTGPGSGDIASHNGLGGNGSTYPTAPRVLTLTNATVASTSLQSGSATLSTTTLESGVSTASRSPAATPSPSAVRSTCMPMPASRWMRRCSRPARDRTRASMRRMSRWAITSTTRPISIRPSRARVQPPCCIRSPAPPLSMWSMRS
ncbi:MAG: hypothetical protein WDO12_07520 [Pseudomonadota bacterium]